MSLFEQNPDGDLNTIYDNVCIPSCDEPDDWWFRRRRSRLLTPESREARDEFRDFLDEPLAMRDVRPERVRRAIREGGSYPVLTASAGLTKPNETTAYWSTDRGPDTVPVSGFEFDDLPHVILSDPPTIRLEADEPRTTRREEDEGVTVAQSDVGRAARVHRPPGSWTLRVAEILCSRRTFENVFEAAVLDMRSEYHGALATGRVWKARVVRLRFGLHVLQLVTRQLGAVLFKLSGLPAAFRQFRGM